MRKSISLFLQVKESGEWVLSRRAKSEKFPGLLQPTVHGSVDEGEDYMIALERELAEEGNFPMNKIEGFTFYDTMMVNQNNNEACSYYIGQISQEDLTLLQPGEEVDSFIKISNNLVPHIKAKDDFEGDDYFQDFVMFRDEFKILHRLASQE